MFLKKQLDLILETPNCILRLPMMSDHLQWVDQRQKSKDFLENWEPIWSPDFFSKRAFQNRVYWANKSFKNLSSLPLFIIRRDDNQLVGAITLDNIRRGTSPIWNSWLLDWSRLCQVRIYVRSYKSCGCLQFF